MDPNPNPRAAPSYLGEGVYVTETPEGVMLTTGSYEPSGADNIVYLGADEIQNLISYLNTISLHRDRNTTSLHRGNFHV